MHVRCPHCHNAIEIVGQEELSDVSCPSCGSKFNLVPETEQYTPTTRSMIIGLVGCLWMLFGSI